MCWVVAGGLVVLVEATRCAFNFVFRCLFFLFLFLLLFSPPLVAMPGQAVFAGWLTAALIEDCEQITKAIYQHFVHVDWVCVCVSVCRWQHPHLLYVKFGAATTGPVKVRKSGEERMAERTEWREPYVFAYCTDAK